MKELFKGDSKRGMLIGITGKETPSDVMRPSPSPPLLPPPGELGALPPIPSMA